MLLGRILPLNVYKHFLLFSNAIYKLYGNAISCGDIDESQSLLQKYHEDIEEYYGHRGYTFKIIH